MCLSNEGKLEKRDCDSASIKMTTHLQGCLCTHFLHIALFLVIKVPKYFGSIYPYKNAN